MILHPAILALLGSSILISSMMLYAAGQGAVILRRWNLADGSELQLALERRTYLISTVTGWFLAFQLSSLFLFIMTADSICHLFVGAMCAVGTLSVNSFGYPALMLKVITCILSGLWLILNHADSLGYDYPLIRPKYRLLLVMAPLILAETVTETIYFAAMRPDIVASCCGTLFRQGSDPVGSALLALPGAPLETLFYGCLAMTLAAGGIFVVREWGAYVFACLSGVAFPVSIASIIFFLSPYFYDMPSHHCPFCILQKEYGYLGYPLYTALLLGTVAGLGVGALHPFRSTDSLGKAIPPMQRKLAVVSTGSFSLFAAIVCYQVVSSSFRADAASPRHLPRLLSRDDCCFRKWEDIDKVGVNGRSCRDVEAPHDAERSVSLLFLFDKSG